MPRQGTIVARSRLVIDRLRDLRRYGTSVVVNQGGQVTIGAVRANAQGAVCASGGTLRPPEFVPA
jgi:hypothetical protein